ncbi:MAG TPA: hypothetical protein VE133_16795 [Candidatus Sulfotelmatobacter sp.]|nr:hypothetical protein [Candidatus Sulfotelmatobacter sp.]
MLLVPDLANPGPPELLGRRSADTKGSFVFRGVPPGLHRLVAFESLELNEEISQQDFLRKIAAQGDSIAVEEKGRYMVHVRLNTEP